MKLEELYELFLESSGVSTDTRKIKQDSIFFALKGDNFNANEFAAEALEKGAQWAVIDEAPETPIERSIQVENVLETLQALSSYHREQLGIPIIGLTGSNGKTTSKELINAALSKKYKTTATFGNLNNHIGVPLTLLSMTGETEIGIVEMGANHQKEIDFLCNIAKPDFGYITNFGKAHLEGFGSVEGVIKGKSELYDYLKKHEKTLFLNIDDPVQKDQLAYPRNFTFGEELNADITVNYFQEGSFAGLQVGDLKILSRMTGSYNAKNMAAAYTIASYFDVKKEDIKEALESYIPGNNRSQIIIKDSIQIILDAYNANPTSMAAAIENLEEIDRKPKAVILGDMFEMGAQAKEEHQHLVDKLKRSNLDRIYLVGENFYRTTSGENILKYKTFEDFTAGFNPSEFENSVLLIKGSRGMALERILEFL